MFRRHGADRSNRQNRLLAAYLAFIGGFVNSAGFVIIGTFTSHVTGNVGRLASDVTTQQFGAALTALTMLIAFFLGAFLASLIIESNVSGRSAHAYGSALLIEAWLLLSFTLVSSVAVAEHARSNDLQAAILCAAMGIQNSLVTRLSGAVVRTTHLTGVFTDIGIEAARWFRWWRNAISAGKRPPSAASAADRPLAPKIILLGTIAGTFAAGAMAGAASATKLRQAAMLLPCAAVVACGSYAFWTGARINDESRK